MVKSNSEKYLASKFAGPPGATKTMADSVSQFRRELLETEIEDGKFRDHNAPESLSRSGLTELGAVVGTGKRIKTASIEKKAGVFDSNSETTGSYRGQGGVDRQMQEVYSPLWLMSNLNLPRDKATINAWCRSFFALNPFVQNAITLHSTYPISKLNIKCKDSKINAFFEDMIDEIDLMNVCVQIAQEYWTLGEAFPYAELDEGSAKWSRITIQNPDYIDVKRNVIANEPVISLRPDENLKRIISGNRPSDLVQRQQLSPSIIEHVRRGENIPLSNFYVSHIARRIAPYDVRGTGLPVSCFRSLMLFDQLYECYSDDTEFLTKDGWKKITDCLELTDSLDINKEYVAGSLVDESGKVKVLHMKNIEVACFNKDNEQLEYYKPEDLHMSWYEGEMVQFKLRNTDIKVTPNHKMWTRKQIMKNRVKLWGEWEKVPAKDLISGVMRQFRATTDWVGQDIEFVEMLGKQVPAELYLKFLGYLISEGYISNKLNGKRSIEFIQNIESDCYKDMRQVLLDIAKILNKNITERVAQPDDPSIYKNLPKRVWTGSIYSKDLAEHCIKEVGFNGGFKSWDKRIPRWVLQLNKEKLNIILTALVNGDGSEIKNRNSTAYKYYTCNKNLADDVQEIVLKCGYSSNTYTRDIRNDRPNNRPEHIVSWSTAADGSTPNFYYNSKAKNKSVDKVDYKGLVWCFTVPTGLFFTRRNGKITIQGNSKYVQASRFNPLTLVKIGGGAGEGYKPTPEDLAQWRSVFEEASYSRDFKLFTHDGVDVQVVGYGSGIYDISGDIERLIKNMYIGLMVPQVLMDGGGDVTYANGGVSLDVLRQRYMQFRNMLSSWLRRKVFAPISKMNDFYDYEGGKKKLIVPEVEWNHMSLFDMGDYIQNLSQLLSQEPRKVSLQTLYRSLGLEYEEEVRKIRRENIEMVIQAKELEALQRMGLNDLRSIGDDDEIQEVIESPLPGESAYDQATGGGLGGPEMGGLGGSPGGLGVGLSGGLGGGLGGGGGLTPPPTMGPPGGLTPPPTPGGP